MKTQQGFSLIELAIVLVIVTLLVGGLAMPLSAQIEARRISETRKTLEEAREAIMGYAMSHTVPSFCNCVYKADTTLNIVDDPVDTSDDPDSSCPVALCPTTGTVTLPLPITRHFLPCPDKLDDGDASTTIDGDGIEELRVGGTCPQEEGYLPWATLATASQDAWGNRLRYAVTSSYTNSINGFSNSSSGTKQVCRTSTGGCPLGTVAQAVPVIIISYGPNGWGGRNVNDSTLRAPTSADELANTNSNNAFVARSPSKEAADEFDDLVVWTSHLVLISRVCPAPGGCP